jgi:hypothetical protein
MKTPSEVLTSLPLRYCPGLRTTIVWVCPSGERSTERLGDLSAWLRSLPQQVGASGDNELDGLQDDDAERGAPAW